MEQAIARKVIFHGEYRTRYTKELTIHANTMLSLCTILFKNAFPDLMHEKALSVVMEDKNGIKTELFDPEQELHPTQNVVHIMPNPDGAYSQLIYAIIVAIVAIGVAYLMAPKTESQLQSGSGNNFDSVDNVIGQGGAIPVVLGTRRVGSRVASHGITSQAYVGIPSQALGG